MDNCINFVATGDSFITRSGADKKSFFNEISELINESDVRFTNLEVTVHDFEASPGAFSGGTWAAASPFVLRDIKEYGFNILGCANNHALDYSQEGLLRTCANLRNSEFKFTGIGSNLSDASEPVYLECDCGTVALISVTSTFHPWWIAGSQRQDIKGRPGVNGLRRVIKHTINKNDMNALKRISEYTDINSQVNLDIKEGFEVINANEFRFGDNYFKEGEDCGTEVFIDYRDEERIFKLIEDAKKQSDFVLLSIHSHEMNGSDKSEPADFIRKFSRDCIDRGAGAVIGHGPHIVRGIEIYKDSPIFYSLGNFIFQNDTVKKQPADFYEKYNLDFKAGPADGYDKRSKGNTVGLSTNPKVWRSIIAKWSFSNGKIENIQLIPIELGFDESRGSRGWPRISKDTEVLNEISELSKTMGTYVEIINGKGVVKKM